MSRVTQAHKAVGVCSVDYRLLRTLAEGEVLAIGKGGHVDPGYLLEDVIPRNFGTLAYYASSTLRGALGSTDDAEPIPAGSFSAGIDTQVDTLFVCNRDGSGGSVSAGIIGRQTPLNNSGKGPPSHPGSGCFPFVVPKLDSDTALETRTIRDRQLVTHIGVYSKTKRTLTGTYTLDVRVRRRGVVHSLLATTFDLESLTDATLASPTLTSAAYLVLEVGDELEVAAAASATLSAGDLLVGVETTLL